MLDIDYHHGNGQQDIFYERPDVFTISIHGHPEFAYPYFTGFANERGGATGFGYNLNIPLPESQNGADHRRALERACKEVVKFAPSFLIVPLGLDPAKGDPTGTWSLVAKDFEANGYMIGQLQLPTLVVQEGGYRTRTLGTNAKYFFTGLVRGAYGPP
jgi:acetoin utilization deacetylase AcuC-like enzyme